MAYLSAGAQKTKDDLQPMLLSSVQTGYYLKLFSTLVEKDAPCSVVELAEPTGADTVFTGEPHPIQIRLAFLETTC